MIETVADLRSRLLVGMLWLAIAVAGTFASSTADPPSGVCHDRAGREILWADVPVGAFSLLGQSPSARHRLGEGIESGKSGGALYEIFRVGRSPVRLSVSWVSRIETYRIETVAVTAKTDGLLFDVADPHGILIGDTERCLMTLRGMPFSTAGGVIRYRADHRVRFYVLDATRRVRVIGDTFDRPYLPPFAFLDATSVLRPVVGVVFLVFALYLIWRSAVYVFSLVSRFDYTISHEAFTMRQRLFGLITFRSRSIVLQRVEAMNVVSQRSAAPFWSFSMLRPCGWMFGLPRARIDGVEVLYRGRRGRLSRLTIYPDDASAFVAQFRSATGTCTGRAGRR